MLLQNNNDAMLILIYTKIRVFAFMLVSFCNFSIFLLFTNIMYRIKCLEENYRLENIKLFP